MYTCMYKNKYKSEDKEKSCALVLRFDARTVSEETFSSCPRFVSFLPVFEKLVFPQGFYTRYTVQSFHFTSIRTILSSTISLSLFFISLLMFYPLTSLCPLVSGLPTCSKQQMKNCRRSQNLPWCASPFLIPRPNLYEIFFFFFFINLHSSIFIYLFIFSFFHFIW